MYQSRLNELISEILSQRRKSYCKNSRLACYSLICSQCRETPFHFMFQALWTSWHKLFVKEIIRKYFFIYFTLRCVKDIRHKESIVGGGEYCLFILINIVVTGRLLKSSSSGWWWEGMLQRTSFSLHTILKHFPPTSSSYLPHIYTTPIFLTHKIQLF